MSETREAELQLAMLTVPRPERGPLQHFEQSGTSLIRLTRKTRPATQTLNIPDFQYRDHGTTGFWTELFAHLSHIFDCVERICIDLLSALQRRQIRIPKCGPTHSSYPSLFTFR